MYAVGSFRGSVDLNPSTGRKDVFSVYSQSDARFALKLDTNGAFVWAAPFLSRSVSGTVGFSDARSIARDGGGNVFAGGRYGGPVDFDPGTGTTSLPAAGCGFVTKLTSNGQLTWTQAFTPASVPTWLSRYGGAAKRGGVTPGATAWFIPDRGRALGVNGQAVYGWIRKGRVTARQVAGRQGRWGVRGTLEEFRRPMANRDRWEKRPGRHWGDAPGAERME